MKSDRQGWLWHLFFILILAALSAFILLDGFVIAREGEAPEISRTPDASLFPSRTTEEGGTTALPETSEPSPQAPVTSESDATTTQESTPATEPETQPPVTGPEPEPDYPIIGDRYYKDKNIEISITVKEIENDYGLVNRVFVADVKLADAEYLRTAFAKDTFGTNIKETTSDIAQRKNAIFAINGDYYGYRDSGWVLRNYHLYRATASRLTHTKNTDDALLFYNNGDILMVHESDYASASVLPPEVYQVFSFGPRLVENGEITVDPRDEVGQSAASNPRTVFGMVEPLHYIFIVAEGRLVRNDGFSLYEIAEIAKDCGCTMAYNLDGGSSTTMYFNGEVLNRTPDDERRISDIIYFNGLTYSEEEGK